MAIFAARLIGEVIWQRLWWGFVREEWGLQNTRDLKIKAVAVEDDG